MADVDTLALTPEQEAEIDAAFKNVIELAGKVSEVIDGNHAAVQSGAIVFVLAAIVAADMANKRFSNHDEAIEHYVEGVKAVLQDAHASKAVKPERVQ